MAPHCRDPRGKERFDPNDAQPRRQAPAGTDMAAWHY